ncbi:MAG: hypothetical protein ABIO62_14480, partial [Paracoccaceae bacterium]
MARQYLCHRLKLHVPTGAAARKNTSGCRLVKHGTSRDTRAFIGCDGGRMAVFAMALAATGGDDKTKSGNDRPVD